MAETDPAPDIEEARRRIAKALAESLEELELGGLALREVPVEVLQLTGLKRLHLGLEKTTNGSGMTPGFGPARNRLAAIDPRLFTTLTRLELLDLASNELTALPSEIGSLQALEVLFLSSNALASLPEEMGGLQ